jgi:hypothetical protein
MKNFPVKCTKSAGLSQIEADHDADRAALEDVGGVLRGDAPDRQGQ